VAYQDSTKGKALALLTANGGKMAEWTSKQGVAGSSPAGRAFIIKGLQLILVPLKNPL